MPTKRTSTDLAELLSSLDTLKRQYEYHFDNVGVKDKEHQDHIHALELDGLLYRERAKLATKMQMSRIERRESKDAINVLEPIYKFLEDEANKKSISKLRQALGEMRKREKYLDERVYHKRISD